MSGIDSMEELFERAKGKLSLKDWEMLFNDVCTSITGKSHYFGGVSEGSEDVGKTFTLGQAMEKAQKATLLDVGGQSEARFKTLLLLRERTGHITSKQANEEREQYERILGSRTRKDN